jgi:hypothetical protein
MDDSFIGINAFFMLNYALSLMAFKHSFGPPYAGRRRVAALREAFCGYAGRLYPMEKVFTPVFLPQRPFLLFQNRTKAARLGIKTG